MLWKQQQLICSLHTTVGCRSLCPRQPAGPCVNSTGACRPHYITHVSGNASAVKPTILSTKDLLTHHTPALQVGAEAVPHDRTGTDAARRDTTSSEQPDKADMTAMLACWSCMLPSACQVPVNGKLRCAEAPTRSAPPGTRSCCSMRLLQMSTHTAASCVMTCPGCNLGTSPLVHATTSVVWQEAIAPP